MCIQWIRFIIIELQQYYQFARRDFVSLLFYLQKKVCEVLPKKKCNKVGCNQLINFNQSYCDEHKHLINEARNNYAQDRYERDKVYAQLYNSKAWRQARHSAAVRDHGLCQYCLHEGVVKKYEVIDHYIPLKYDFDKRLDLDNLVASCTYHNTIKEKDERLLRENKITLDEFKNRWQYGINK